MTQKSNIPYIFFGSPEFSVSVLKQLKSANLPPSLVVTAPDKKRGRGQDLQPTPVKRWSQNQEVETVTPESVNQEFLQKFEKKAPNDSKWPLFVVVAYGQILPSEIIYYPEHNTLNLHPSLLPRVRGAAPIRGAILTEDKTGVSVIELDEKMDHGPIVAQKEVSVDEWPPYYDELKPKLAKAGGQLLAETLPEWVAGRIKSTPQDHTNASYVGKFDSNDGKIDFSDPTETNLRKIRAFTDWPKAHFYHEDMRVIIIKAHREDGELIIDKVKPSGHSTMAHNDFQKQF
jgi:methionyl-tRNA formyltransferase